ncbi:winged helix-turn-helix domain-containing protein [Desulfovibrio mangrovi]|uniref:winged helix-turn-helix domain-containing protein n=1 Tax=Desulfovibrio mangrovi TaxID=2976983 RepID=UPI0022466BCF|nr:winged helix-turn-helix domain-containing protein [Desulfovibrio mangrovi]UZP67446.1 winged helix-turn-helix domain-containing protein [Desulfovibrio mangrovi]
MYIHLACSSEEIISFVSRGLVKSGEQLSVISAPDALTVQMLSSQPEQQSAFMLDLDYVHASTMLDTLRQSDPLAGIPLIVLVNSKHVEPHEPPTPPHAVRVRKPFCINAIHQGIRRSKRIINGQPNEVLEAGDIQLAPSTGATFKAGRSLRTHPRETLLLETFMRSPGEVLSREFILDNFFDYTARPRPNLVDVLACRLRSRLHAGTDKQVLHTVRGQGYMFKP